MSYIFTKILVGLWALFLRTKNVYKILDFIRKYIGMKQNPEFH